MSEYLLSFSAYFSRHIIPEISILFLTFAPKTKINHYEY